MSAADLIALAERVEKASGPNALLDCQIENALGLARWKRDPRIGYGDAEYYREPIKPFTASLDAAMTLVPQGFMWRLQSWPDGVNGALLEKNAGDFGAIDARHTETFAATPALALTAAALRARAATITPDSATSGDER